MQIPPAGLSLIILYWFCFRLFLEFIYSLPLSPSLSLARSLSLSLSLFLCSILLSLLSRSLSFFFFLFLSLSFSFYISFSRVALRLPLSLSLSPFVGRSDCADGKCKANEPRKRRKGRKGSEQAPLIRDKGLYGFGTGNRRHTHGS